MEIPSEIDILNEIDRFSTDNNNNNNNNNNKSYLLNKPENTNQQQQPANIIPTNSNNKLQNPNETVLTQETVKIFSSIPKNLPFK